MSIALMTQAWKMHMQAGRKMVLLALCDSANDEGKCWPSIDSLMQKCSMGERTVQQHVAAMEVDGLIKRDMRAGRSTMYHINSRKLCAPAESAPPQISHCTPAENNSTAPQNLHRTSADFAPITVKEAKVEPKQKRQVVRGTRLPADWILKGKHAKAAAKIAPAWTADEIRLIGDKFKDHWISVSGEKGCKLDWDATWRNWCRNEQKAAAKKPGGRDAWWESAEKVIAKGASLGLKPGIGESPYTFKDRVQAAVDNGGAPPVVVSGQKISILPQLPENITPVSSENRAAALKAARNLKSRDPDGTATY